MINLYHLEYRILMKPLYTKKYSYYDHVIILKKRN